MICERNIETVSEGVKFFPFSFIEISGLFGGWKSGGKTRFMKFSKRRHHETDRWKLKMGKAAII
jgi:hypothetical protein